MEGPEQQDFNFRNRLPGKRSRIPDFIPTPLPSEPKLTPGEQKNKDEQKKKDIKS